MTPKAIARLKKISEEWFAGTGSKTDQDVAIAMRWAHYKGMEQAQEMIAAYLESVEEVLHEEGIILNIREGEWARD